MHIHRARTVVIAAFVGISSLLGALPAARGAGEAQDAPTRPPSGVEPSAPGDELWVTRNPELHVARAVEVSPDGATVFVTGYDALGGPSDWADYVTVAYDSGTGAEVWRQRYSGISDDYASDLAVSPDGSTVYVTGESYGAEANFDYRTIAYEAVTGDELWSRRYDGEANGNDIPMALAVSPDGSRLFLTGGSEGTSRYSGGYGTMAYDAATGAELWTHSSNKPGYGERNGVDLGVSPDGSRVFVSGSIHRSTRTQYRTVAHDATTGQKLWTRRYEAPEKRFAYVRALGVSPDGSKVFVTGYTDEGSDEVEVATVAYDAATGAELWSPRRNGPGSGEGVAAALGVSPDGSMVFVTGYSVGPIAYQYRYRTIAYDAATGAQLWERRYGRQANYDFSFALGVSPDGSTVFVTGTSGSGTPGPTDYSTVAYDATTGGSLWERLYDGPTHDSDGAYALGVSPDGSKVFVAGYSESGSMSGSDAATVAYSTN